jgi:hypothetical protein
MFLHIRCFFSDIYWHGIDLQKREIRPFESGRADLPVGLEARQRVPTETGLGFLRTANIGKTARTECRALPALVPAMHETGILPPPEADFAQHVVNARLTKATAVNPTPTAGDLNPTAVNSTPTADGLNPTALDPIATADDPIPTAVNLIAPARHPIATAGDTISTAAGSMPTATGLKAAADGLFACICRAIAGGIERSKQKVREWFHSRTAQS